MDTGPIDANALSGQMQQREMLEKELTLRSLKANLTPGPDKEKKLREVCKGFESIFINKLWQEMRNTVPKEGYLHSKQEEFYLSMFDQEMSNKLAEAGGIGLGDMLYEQLKSTAEGASRVTAPSRVTNPKDVKPLRTSLEERKQQPLAAAQESAGPLYTPLEDGGDNQDAQGQNLVATTQNSVAETQTGRYSPAGRKAQAPEPPMDQISLRAALTKPAAQRYNPPLGQRSGTGPRTQTTNATAFTQAQQPASANLTPYGAQAMQNAFAPSAATQRPSQTSLAGPPPTPAQTVPSSPGDLSAVDSLVSNITQQTDQPTSAGFAAKPSPVTAAPSRTQLRPPQAPQTQTPQSLEPTPIPTTNQNRVDPSGPIERLDSGIRNKQGALPNEGGPEPARGRIGTPLLATSVTPSFKKGPLTWPVDGDATSNFGLRRSAFTGEIGAHEGVDIAANHGDLVKACWDGKVIFSGEQESYGKLVILDHGDGWRSYYGHNSANAARVGDIVRAGAPIARAGSTGNSTGPHVHFELRHNDAAVDPILVEQRFQASLSKQAS